jgi:hypothetical protein
MSDVVRFIKRTPILLGASGGLVLLTIMILPITVPVAIYSLLTLDDIEKAMEDGEVQPGEGDELGLPVWRMVCAIGMFLPLLPLMPLARLWRGAWRRV